MGGRRQKLVAGSLATVGTVLVILTGIALFDEICRLRFAENVILRQQPRDESRWYLTETKSGFLIRAKNGKFKNWYLAADDLVNPEPRVEVKFFLGTPRSPDYYVRNVILRDKVGADCYWNLTQTAPGTWQIQAKGGRYKDWHLDFLAEYIPDSGREPRSAWNLVSKQARFDRSALVLGLHEPKASSLG